MRHSRLKFQFQIASFLKLVIASALVFIVAPAYAGNSLSEISQRCAGDQSTGPVLYDDDFKWGYTLTEMLEKYSDIYYSNQRLARRAYVNLFNQKIYLPYEASRGGHIEISTEFIETIKNHIEKAFVNNYIHAVFFPDMGHSHLLIPEKLYNEVYDLYPISEMSRMYEDLFKDQRLEILYHTAEQLQMLDSNQKPMNDPLIQHRLKTRNIVGFNHPQSELIYLSNPSSAVNTVSSRPGYYWWGAGFNISANKNGCFEYKNKDQSFYFDLSMYDLASSSTK